MISQPKYIKFKFPGTPDVTCAFGTRLGGLSRDSFQGNNISFEVGDLPENVLGNRNLAENEIGFERLMDLKQVHGDVVHFDLKGDFLEGSRYEGDGVCTSEAGVALMIKTADCQPVFMVHESARYICALHVGWRGNRMNFPGTGLRLFCDHYGIDSREVLAVRGPSLGPCCAEFTDFHEHWDQGFEGYYSSKSKTMDLWSLSRDQLINGGIRQENIYSMDICTKCNKDLFFSYRREKISGRQANFLMIEM